MPVRIISLQKTKIKKREIQRVVKKTIEEVGAKREDINIVLADDSLLRELNLRYRGIDAPTDVLSFPYLEEDLLGEVIISLDACERQAKSMGHSFERELETLIVHGVLHLIGFDDQDEENEKIMMELQNKIINKIGGYEDEKEPK